MWCIHSVAPRESQLERKRILFYQRPDLKMIDALPNKYVEMQLET